MKDKILHKATDMFLNIGFKSVTMDDISHSLGISKKTVYTHFRNKNKLVEAVTTHMFDNIQCGIDSICCKEQNSIEELFEIKEYLMKSLNNEKSSPSFQLQKFFPEIHSKLKKNKMGAMRKCVAENITRGMNNGVYRSNLNVEFVTRIYYHGMLGIKDEDLFPPELFNKSEIINEYLEYHTRAIATEKGLETLNKILNTNKN